MQSCNFSAFAQLKFSCIGKCMFLHSWKETSSLLWKRRNELLENDVETHGYQATQKTLDLNGLPHLPNCNVKQPWLLE